MLRILLGAQLRRLRESAGISREDAGYHIRASGSKISRMELGRVSFKERDVTDLLEFYGVGDPEEREKLVQLTREANADPLVAEVPGSGARLVSGLRGARGGRPAHP